MSVSSKVTGKDTSITTNESTDVSSIVKEQLPREIETNSYFDKLLYVARERRQSNSTTGKTSLVSDDQLADGLESLIESIQTSKLWNSNDTKTDRSQETILLLELKKLKEIYAKNSVINSTSREQLEKCRISIDAVEEVVHFDFSEQSIGDDIHLRLMQLVRLSKLDKLMEKIFHKSGQF